MSRPIAAWRNGVEAGATGATGTTVARAAGVLGDGAMHEPAHVKRPADKTDESGRVIRKKTARESDVIHYASPDLSEPQVPCDSHRARRGAWQAGALPAVPSARAGARQHADARAEAGGVARGRGVTALGAIGVERIR